MGFSTKFYIYFPCHKLQMNVRWHYLKKILSPPLQMAFALQVQERDMKEEINIIDGMHLQFPRSQGIQA